MFCDLEFMSSEVMSAIPSSWARHSGTTTPRVLRAQCLLLRPRNSSASLTVPTTPRNPPREVCVWGGGVYYSHERLHFPAGGAVLKAVHSAAQRTLGQPRAVCGSARRTSAAAHAELSPRIPGRFTSPSATAAAAFAACRLPECWRKRARCWRTC